MTANHASDSRTTATMMALRYDPQTARVSYEAVSRPAPGVDDVLVEVHAAGITNCVAGDRSVEDGCLPGSGRPHAAEFAGKVAAFGGGDGEGRFVVGEQVYGIAPLAGDGAAAEFVVVPATSLAGRPRSISFAESAALPVAAVTAWNAVAHLDLRVGQSVLVADGSTEAGVYAIQIAAFLGAAVTAVAPSSHDELLRSLGADSVVDRTAVSPDTDHFIGSLSAVAPEASEPQLTVIAGLVDLGKLRPILGDAIPIELAAAILPNATSRVQPGRTVLVVR